jgi:hypothetical protein
MQLSLGFLWFASFFTLHTWIERVEDTEMNVHCIEETPKTGRKERGEGTEMSDLTNFPLLFFVHPLGHGEGSSVAGKGLE